MIRHAGFQALAVIALAVTMIETPFKTLLMAAVGLAALQAKGFLPATGGTVALATIAVAAEIEHRPTGRKTADPLRKTVEQATRTGLETEQWGTTGADHDRMTGVREVLDQGHQQKAPAASNNRGLLSAFGNSSYQIRGRQDYSEE